MAGKTEKPQVDLDNLTEEEAEKMLAQEEAADSDDGEKEEKSEKDAEATTDDSEKDDDGGEEAEEDGQQEEDTDKAEEGEEKRDPLKDTQRAFHEKARALKEAELENQRLKAELDALKNGAASGGKKYADGMTDQELEDLQYEDPNKWRHVMNDRDKADAEREAATQQHAQAGEEITAKRQLLNTLDFAQQVLGVDLSSIADPFNPENIPEQVRKYLTSEEFQRLEKEVVDNFRPGNDGIYTSDQLQKAHRLVNWDQFAAEQRQKGAEASLMAIKKAAQTGSKLDNAPKNDGAKSMRSIDKLTQHDIEAMGAGELESYYKEMGLDE